MIGTSQKSGFTLIEVALALVIMAIGLTSVFALFPAGLEQTQKGIDDIRLAMFAQDAFAAVKGKAMINDWADVSNGNSKMESKAIAQDVWDDPSTLDIITGGATPHKHFYKLNAAGDSIESHTLAYLITIDTVGGNTARKSVKIEVWPNAYNTAATNPRKRVFYSELYDPGVN